MEFMHLLNQNTWVVFTIIFGMNFMGFAELGARLGSGRR